MESKKAEEIKKKAEADASKMFKGAEQKGRQIMEEAKKKAEAEASKIIAEAEQKARQIIEEAERIAAAPAAQRPQQIMKAVREKAASEAKGKVDQQEAAYKKRVEIVIIPPVDFAQLEKLRVSLQRFPDLRVLSTGGSPDGSTHISVMMDKPAPLAESLRKLEVIEEAIEEEQLDSHPLGDIMKKAMPSRSSKQREEQRVLVVLKRAQ